MKGVYYIKCYKSDYFYIGSSKDIEHRIKTHFFKLKSNVHENRHLQNAYNKYGKDSFYYGVAELSEDCIECEQVHIDKYDFKQLYNMTRFSTGGGGDSNCKGYLLLDKEMNLVDVFESGNQLSRTYFPTSIQLNYNQVNNDCVVSRKYRIVTQEFMENDLYKSLPWSSQRKKDNYKRNNKQELYKNNLVNVDVDVKRIFINFTERK